MRSFSVFTSLLVSASRVKPSSVSTQTETYHTSSRRLAGTCGHAFADGEKQVCCDHLANKSRLEPIRIKSFWEPPQDYNSTYKQFITDTITAATNYWMSTLSVHRVAGNLYTGTMTPEVTSANRLFFVDAPDDFFWVLKPGKTKHQFKDELSRAFACGSNNVPMPSVTHNEVKVCDSGTDPRRNPSACETIPAQAGVPADLVLVFTLEDCGVGASSLASAVSCQDDQCGRSTFGAVQICKEAIHSLFTHKFDKMYRLEQRRKHFRYVMIHEIAHVLVFDSSKFDLFRNSDGSAMVPHDDTGALSRVTFLCDSRQVVWPAAANSANRRHYVDLVASGILKLAAYHGHSISECKCAGLTEGSPISKVMECLAASNDESKAPSCVFVVSTPKVKAAAQEYFGCPSLEGMPLENRPTAECSVYGSHWESIAIQEEVMAPATGVQTQGKFVSKITLALMEDSGWYGVNYSLSTKLVNGIHWGYQAGCDFLNQKCSEIHPTDGYFCAQNEESCSRGFRQKVKCSACTIGSTVLPEVWQYFNDPRQVCNSGKSVSNCPIFQPTHYSGLECRANSVERSCRSGFCQEVDSGGNAVGTCSSASTLCKCTETADTNSDFEVASTDCRLSGLASWWHGETHGEQSYCFMSTWYQIEKEWVLDARETAEKPRCFTIACSGDRRSYTVYMIREKSGNPVSVGVCTSESDTIDPSGSLGSNAGAHHFGGSVKCHAPGKVCRTTNELLDDRDFSSAPPHATDSPAPSPSPAPAPQPDGSGSVPPASKSKLLFGLPCVVLLTLFFGSGI